jgi:hypothetical protein
MFYNMCGVINGLIMIVVWFCFLAAGAMLSVVMRLEADTETYINVG